MLKNYLFWIQYFLCGSAMFANKYMALSVKYTALLARPIVLREKLCFCEFRSVKYNTSNLGRILIFFPE